MNDKKLVVVPGFRKDETPHKVMELARAQKQRQEEMIRRSMPVHLILQFNACVVGILQDGKPKQMVLELGPDKEHAKKLRVTMTMFDYGDVVDTADGKKVRLIPVEENDGLQHDHDARTGGEESHSGCTAVQPEQQN